MLTLCPDKPVGRLRTSKEVTFVNWLVSRVLTNSSCPFLSPWHTQTHRHTDRASRMQSYTHSYRLALLAVQQNEECDKHSPSITYTRCPLPPPDQPTSTRTTCENMCHVLCLDHGWLRCTVSVNTTDSWYSKRKQWNCERQSTPVLPVCQSVITPSHHTCHHTYSLSYLYIRNECLTNTKHKAVFSVTCALFINKTWHSLHFLSLLLS